MKNVIIFGLPGSGKGTQSRLICKEYGFKMISTGDLLRWISTTESVYSEIISSCIKNGALVDDDLICKIVRERLNLLVDQPGIVFDGFPRNLKQAQFLTSIDRSIDVVVELVVDVGSVFKRLEGRLLCADCSYVTNADYLLFDGGCKNCGSKNLKVRNDDSDFDIVKKRVDCYNMQSEILCDYYKSKVKRINGARPIENVWQEVKGIIDLFM